MAGKLIISLNWVILFFNGLFPTTGDKLGVQSPNSSRGLATDLNSASSE